MSTQLSRHGVMTVVTGAAFGAVATPSFALAQPTAAQGPAVSAGEFPKGFAVEPTRILFTPKVFEVVRSGCGTDQPNCVGFVFRASAQRCDLLVRLVGEIPEGTGPSVGFAGLAYCPRNDSACRDFVASIEDQKQISVQLLVPPQPEPETT